MINRTILLRIFVGFLFILGSVHGKATEPAKKKLQIFILAGQSNMVGHAYYITIPTLLATKDPEVRELAKMVFKKEAKISRAVVEDLIATRMRRDAINKDLREKKIEGGNKIAAAQAEIKKLQAQTDAKMQKINYRRRMHRRHAGQTKNRGTRARPAETS